MRQSPIAGSIRRAFTLIELLVVIAIIGLLAGLAVPVLSNFKPNYTASFTQQLLTGIGRARQLAISQHTTVYMVFVPTNYWNDPAFPNPNFTLADRTALTNLFDKQTIGYNFVSLRSLGDQPGRPTAHYLSSWKALPEGGFIHPAKFQVYQPNRTIFTMYTNNGPPAFRVFGFTETNTIPFPLENTQRASPRAPYVTLPYIAFDYMGRLTSGRDEVIPVTRGSIVFARDTNKKPRQGLPNFNETPAGNTTNGFNLVYIDWLTGRARALQKEVR